MLLAHTVGRSVGRAAVVVLIALLAACATTTPPVDEASPVKPVAKPPVRTTVTPPSVDYETPPRTPTHSASAAWQPLLTKAEQATESGDYEQALALLERAQRIDPDSAEVYLGIARTHLAKGDAAQARATAERGLLYCSSAAVCDALRALTR